MAGTGLVYTCEVLFRARIAPTSPGRDLAPEEWSALCLLCGGEIRRGALAGRNSYWCPTCQLAGTAAA